MGLCFITVSLVVQFDNRTALKLWLENGMKVEIHVVKHIKMLKVYVFFLEILAFIFVKAPGVIFELLKFLYAR